jgi:hypothetical protein
VQTDDARGGVDRQALGGVDARVAHDALLDVALDDLVELGGSVRLGVGAALLDLFDRDLFDRHKRLRRQHDDAFFLGGRNVGRVLLGVPFAVELAVDQSERTHFELGRAVGALETEWSRTE